MTRDCPSCPAKAGAWCEAPRLHLTRHTRLTTGEVAAYLQVSQFTVKRMIAAGALPGVKDPDSGWWWVAPEDVWEWVDTATTERTAV